MKRNFLHALMFAAGIFVLSACGDDDDGPSNYVTHDGTTKGIVTAIAFSGGADSGADGKKVYIHDLTFADVSIDKAETAAFSAFNLTLYTAAEALADGTYTVITDKKDLKASVADNGSVSIDVKYKDNGDLASGKEYEIISGSATLKKSGDSYTFDFTGKAVVEGAAASTAKDVKVHYAGTFMTL